MSGFNPNEAQIFTLGLCNKYSASKKRFAEGGKKNLKPPPSLAPKAPRELITQLMEFCALFGSASLFTFNSYGVAEQKHEPI